MRIENELEIILITYNRKACLEQTLTELLSDESPVKNTSITILDNASTDGTSELCARLVHNHANIAYLKNDKNIGISGNIIKAMSLPKKTWAWFLCDDDHLDWAYWPEVAAALEEDNGAVMVSRNTESHNLPIEVIANELSFLPAAIYRTENIDGEVLQKAIINAYTLFPHLALVCHLINNNKKIFVPEHTIVKQSFSVKKDTKEYSRGSNTSHLHFRQALFHLFVGYINSFGMINDKKLRYKCCGCLVIGRSFSYAILALLKQKKLRPYNICDIINGVSFWQKLMVLKELFLWPLRRFIFDIEISDEKIRIVFFGVLKIHIRFKPKKGGVDA